MSSAREPRAKAKVAKAAAGPARVERARIGLPSRFHLPSGRRVAIDWEVASAAAAAAPGDASASATGCVAGALALLRHPAVLTDVGGAATAVGDLALADAHVLVALVCHAGLVDEPAVTVACDNCREELSVRPSATFEPGPFADGELSDRELDAPFDFDRAHALPAVFTTAGVARSVTLAPRTVDEAALLVGAAAGAVLPSPASIMALGVRRLGQERRARHIARALDRAGDDAWSALADIWEQAHYPERLMVEVFCSCGAKAYVLAPGQRLFDALAPPTGEAAPEPPSRPGFPSVEEFERRAERARRLTYSAKGVRNVPVVVDHGVPVCDDGGEPLLGCYTPPGGDGDLLQQGPEIRLFYRTFQSEFRADASFDVSAEIRETIEHEVEHHLYFLSGHDPMDDDERAVIAQERARNVGRKELMRREARTALADFLGFLWRAWPLLVLLLLLTIAMIYRR